MKYLLIGTSVMLFLALIACTEGLLDALGFGGCMAVEFVGMAICCSLYKLGDML